MPLQDSNAPLPDFNVPLQDSNLYQPTLAEGS